MILSPLNYSEIRQNSQINNKATPFWLENFYVKANRNIYLPNFTNKGQLTKLKIRRLLQSDKFIIEFSHLNFHYEINDINVEVAINNKKVEFNKLRALDGTYIFSFISEKNSEINKLLFNQILNIDFEVKYKIGNTWYQAEGYTYYLNHIKNNKVIKVDTNGANINLLTIMEISSFSNEKNLTITEHHENREYISFHFKPKILKQGLHNTKIFDFSIIKANSKGDISRIINQSDVYGLNIIGRIDIPNVKGNISLRYNPWDDNKSITIDSYSYFDKKVNSVIVSPNDFSAKQGLIIPPNFSGNLSENLDITFGENLKNFSIIYNQFIPKPLFSELDGLINLNLKKISGWLTKEKWHTIKLNNIEEIISKAKTLKEIEKIGEK
ncbi:MHO_1580 family protein [Metamycoplasma equirhinis]|uniref:MHO_1580 family protein n=1 Tax=Metamycoplasma equirhinis TaxID=92402 RepID=UPI0035932D8A